MLGTDQIAAGQIYTHLLPLKIGEYLESYQFSLFLKNHDLDDAWKQFLVESQDKPDLYGDSVEKNAFTSFLLHVFHSRHKEFPAIVSAFFKSIATGCSHLLPVSDLKHDLQDLGYSEHETDTIFCNEFVPG